MEKEIKNFVDYCKEYIADTIDGYEGQDVYLCDLGYTLTEGPNADGSLTYSSALARDYLREWYEEAGAYYEYEKDNFGDHYHNPFDNPEAYMVCMVITGVDHLIQDAIVDLGMDDQWDDKVELTPELCAQIVEKVNENNRDYLF